MLAIDESHDITEHAAQMSIDELIRHRDGRTRDLKLLRRQARDLGFYTGLMSSLAKRKTYERDVLQRHLNNARARNNDAS